MYFGREREPVTVSQESDGPCLAACWEAGDSFCWLFTLAFCCQ